MVPLRSEERWHEICEGIRITPVFQPIVALADGRVVAYEALSRPADADGRPVPILHLVELAQRINAEVDLDALAIEAVAGAAPGLPPGVRLFVNVSPLTVLDRPSALAPLNAVSDRLVLEVTEHSPIPEGREEEFLRAAGRLRRQRAQFAMDDCGAGYSGLNRLVALHPDFAKVDMALVRDVDCDSAKAQLVQALVSFARQAGISVIAEGVETEAERDTLAELGVTYAQGYLIGRPAPGFGVPERPRRVRPTAAPAVDAASALGALTRLARMAARGLGDAAGLHEAIVQAARAATHADLVVLRRRAAHTLVPVAVVGAPLAEQRSIPLSVPDPVGDAFMAGRVVVRQARRPGSDQGSGVAAPILLDDEGWGMLALGYMQESRVRADLVDLATGLADHAALILAGARRDQAAAQTPVLDVLRQLSARPDDLSGLFAHVVADVERETGSHDCWIGSVRDDRMDIVTGSGGTASVPLADWLDPASDMSRMPPGVALREARTVVVDDIRLEPSLASQLDELLAQAIISAAAVPIVADGRVLGILKVYHSTVAAFTPGQVALLEEVAALLAALMVGRAGPKGCASGQGAPH